MAAGAGSSSAGAGRWRKGEERLPALWLAFLLLLASHCELCTAVLGWEYAVLIDAGTTGSRVHVYRFYRHKEFPYATVELPDAVHKTTPGLSAYSFDPKTGANSLQPLLKFAKEQVPEGQWARTPLQLMATAGLRMLPDEAGGRLLDEARKALAGSGFLFRPAWAKVISGQQEGMYAWVAVNYASGALQALAQQQQLAAAGRKELPGGLERIKPTAPLMGVFDLGGGSLQVTFALPAGRRIPPNQAAPLAMPGLGDRQVYSHSFDGFGLQAAMARHTARLSSAGAKADPCLPRGFRSDASGLAGSGDWAACRAAARALLPAERCTFSSCSLGNVFTPPVEGPVLGIDNFFYSARALRLKPGPIRLPDYEAAAARFCGKSWADIKREFLKHSSGSDTYTLQVCFAAAHVLSILRDGLHMGNASATLTLANDVGTPKGETFPASWTLGALMVDVLRTGGGGGSGDGGGGDESPLALSARAAAGGAESGGAPAHAVLLPPPKTDGGAAALAAAFCGGLIALMAILSKAKVGIIPGPDRLEKVRSGTPTDLETQALISTAPGGGGAVDRERERGERGGERGGGGLVQLVASAAAAAGGNRVSASSSRRRGE